MPSVVQNTNFYSKQTIMKNKTRRIMRCVWQKGSSEAKIWLLRLNYCLLSSYKWILLVFTKPQDNYIVTQGCPISVIITNTHDYQPSEQFTKCEIIHINLPSGYTTCNNRNSYTYPQYQYINNNGDKQCRESVLNIGIYAQLRLHCNLLVFGVHCINGWGNGNTLRQTKPIDVS